MLLKKVILKISILYTTFVFVKVGQGHSEFVDVSSQKEVQTQHHLFTLDLVVQTNRSPFNCCTNTMNALTD